MVFWTYFRFLSMSLLKKKSIWIFGFLYLFFSFLILILVPIITGNTPWQLWNNMSVNPQTLLLYVAAIFGAIVSIAIFKDYRDDGTELILVTKPISRVKATVAKFVLFFAFTFGFTLITLINAPLTFVFKDVTTSQVNSLVTSMLFANFMILVIYGMLATLISLFANKIWTILANVILVVLLVILSTVNALVIKTPAALAKSDSHAIVSAQYLANDNKFHSFASLTPTISANDDNFEISFTTIEQEKAKWQEYTNSSQSGLADFFDFSGQFTLLNNMWALQDELTKRASDGFGTDRFYDYEMQNYILDESDDFLPSYYVEMPSGFTSIGGIDFLSIPEISAKAVERYFKLMTDQSIVMIGQSEVDASSLISTIMPHQFYVAKGNNGWSGTNKNVINYQYDDLKPNQLQQEIFDKILSAILNGDYSNENDDSNIYTFRDDLQSINNYFEDPKSWKFTSSDDVLSTLWTPSLTGGNINENNSFLQVLDESSLANCVNTNSGSAIYNFIHACLVGANKGLTNLDGGLTTEGKYQNAFWNSSLTYPKTNEELMKTIAMFKLYGFQKLTKLINEQNLNKYANNTAVNLNGYSFSSQPILPLNPNADNEYNMGGNIPLTELPTELPYGILSTIIPSADRDLSIIWPKDVKWADANDNPKQPSYFTDPEILKARAILDWLSSQQKYGFNDAIDSGLSGDGDPELAFDRDQNYNVNLVTTSVNFPLIYECLGATYTAHPKIDIWEMILLWTLIGMLLTTLSFAIYIRTDFK